MTTTIMEPLTPDETARLAALERYDILDTAPEPAFDRVVDLARALFNTPIAMVTFVDQTRQWFKARTGLEIHETSRAVAFCDHAIRQDDVMVVGDATKDPRFAANPLVVGEPGIRFYAGAPIRSSDGHKLGTVCILSDQPRDLTDTDRQRLVALSGIVTHELELRIQTRRMADLAEERHFLLQEMDLRLQNSLHLVGKVLQDQARQAPSADVRRALLAAADRIVTVALISRNLGRAEHNADETGGEYVLSLCEEIQAALIDGLHGRSLRIDIAADLPIPPRQRPRLGFILSELINNAVKHGRGAITLRVTHDGLRTKVCIHDQGDGYGARHMGKAPSWGAGLRLVAALCEGDIHVDPEDRRSLLVSIADETLRR